MVKMMQEKTNEFVPFTSWKPFHKITFMDYEFTVNGKNIEFDDKLMPMQLDVKRGDKFTVHIDDFGKITLVRDE
jgi:hypothetical protein